MPTLSISQMVDYARSAGLSDDAAVIAGAVGMAESSGKTDVVNFLGCTGIWQIYVRVHHKLITSKYPGIDPTTAMKDPAKNAAIMAILSKNGTNWQPWEAYTNKSYIKYVNEAAKASKEKGWKSGDYKPKDQTLAAPHTNVFASMLDPGTWLRFMYAIAGVVLIGIAVMRMSGTDKVVKTAAKVALIRKV